MYLSLLFMLNLHYLLKRKTSIVFVSKCFCKFENDTYSGDVTTFVFFHIVFFLVIILQNRSDPFQIIFFT